MLMPVYKEGIIYFPGDPIVPPHPIYVPRNPIDHSLYLLNLTPLHASLAPFAPFPPHFFFFLFLYSLKA